MFEIGRENVQLKIKTVKSIRNRCLYFNRDNYQCLNRQKDNLHVHSF